MKQLVQRLCIGVLACAIAQSCLSGRSFDSRGTIDGSLRDSSYVAPGGAWSFAVDGEPRGFGASFVDGADGTGGRYVTRHVVAWGWIDVWVAPVTAHAASVAALGGVEELADTQSANHVRELEALDATVHVLSRALTTVQGRPTVRHVYEVRAPDMEAHGWPYFLLGEQERWYVEVVDVVDWGDALVRFTGAFELNPKHGADDFFNAAPVARAQELIATPEATFARPAAAR